MFTDSTPGYFPLSYYRDFLELLGSRRERVEFLTYHDLEWGDDYDFKGAYPQEFASWREKLSRGELSSDKAYVLIQHDVDSHPERTLQMMRVERELGVPSSVMLFCRRVDRHHFLSTGEIRLNQYDLDVESLKQFERDGFVIGYHSNAFERGEFDEARAQRVFEEDVAWLRRHFDLRVFSAHGGCKDPNGRSNGAFVPEQAGPDPLRWVHNRFTVRFHKTFSDGGINNPKRDPDSLNLASFLAGVAPGARYRLLLHPQYYDDSFAATPALEGVPWYRDVLQCYGSSSPGNYWADYAQSRDIPILRG